MNSKDINVREHKAMMTTIRSNRDAKNYIKNIESGTLSLNSNEDHTNKSFQIMSIHSSTCDICGSTAAIAR
jgi:hypothetical protein